MSGSELLWKQVPLNPEMSEMGDMNGDITQAMTIEAFYVLPKLIIN